MMFQSRGVAYTGYNVPDNAEKEEEGEKREIPFLPYYPLIKPNIRCPVASDIANRR